MDSGEKTITILVSIFFVCLTTFGLGAVYLENQSFQTAVKAGLVQKSAGYNRTIWVKDEGKQD